MFVFTHETTDGQSRLIVNVLFVQLAQSTTAEVQPILAEDEVAVIGCIVPKTLRPTELNVKTQWAAHKSSLKECRKPPCEGAVHIMCVAHSVNTVGSTLQDPLWRRPRLAWKSVGSSVPRKHLSELGGICGLKLLSGTLLTLRAPSCFE